jgi:hypothetical protein
VSSVPRREKSAVHDAQLVEESNVVSGIHLQRKGRLPEREMQYCEY